MKTHSTVTSSAALLLGALLAAPSCAKSSAPGSAPGSGSGAGSGAARAVTLTPTFEGVDGQRRQIGVGLVQVAEGFDQPTDIQAVPGQAGRLVVLEKSGAAKWWVPASGEVGPWLRRAVLTRSEQGLLGLAFHPKFASNGRFFVNYSVDVGGQKTTRVAEWAVAAGKALAETAPREVRTIIEVAQPWANHNAGQLAFGPDAMLYVGLGDGGAANDPKGHGQNLGTLLGSMLRIDVDRPGEGGRAYAIPADNPFVKQAGARPEIWAYGLRNPWRYAFAPDGRLVVADVGQNRYEEIAIVGKGENHGWNRREGRHCFPPGSDCADFASVDPIWEYPRSEGVSVTGGLVYTGSVVALRGLYVFGDYGSGRLWALPLPSAEGGAASEPVRALGRFEVSPTAFGVDHDGEMYVADFARGRIYRITDR